MPRFAVLCCTLLLACVRLTLAGAHAQSYPTLASEPDPRDFVRHAGAQLTLSGIPFRFGGVDVTWLGIRQDGSAPARRPTRYEVLDALQTAQALGAAVVRAPGLADTAGCALCLEPAPGQLDDAAFAQLDMVLAIARDLGLKLILPLADSGRDCAGPSPSGSICMAARVPGAADGRAFFTDARLTGALTARVRALLQHRSTVTGMLYRDDPTILAWEDCDACAVPDADQAVAMWSDQLGRIVKAEDSRHLYATAAFAGRIGPGAARRATSSLYAVPSADIVADCPVPPADPIAARATLAAIADEATATGHALMLQGLGWAPALWKTGADLDGWLATIARTRPVSGATVGILQAHAQAGGWLPAPPPPGNGVGALYFPGRATPEMDMPAMQERGRALRRFNYAIGGVTLTPPYLLPPQPAIISTAAGRVAWRGAAGAASYSVERSADPGQPGSWSVLCDACTTDDAGFWQDPHPEAGDWYRVMPLNINGHRAEPSLAVQSP